MKSVFDAANAIYGQKKLVENRNDYNVFLANNPLTLNLPKPAPQGAPPRPMLRAEDVTTPQTSPQEILPWDATDAGIINATEMLRRFNSGELSEDQLSRNLGFDNSVTVPGTREPKSLIEQGNDGRTELDYMNINWQNLNDRKARGETLTEVEENYLRELTRFRAMRVGA
tara:strand:- start:1623 stop:2132 length:510 start_codon:yes stop_codon:yes gene_type:complete